MDNLVSIAKVEGNIENTVKKAIRLVGGMESVVNRGDKIYLKPNFVAPRDASHGVTTELEIVRVVAEEVHRCGGIPILYETPAIEFDRNKVFEVLEIFSFAKENGIQLINGSVDMMKVPVPNGLIYRTLKIPTILHKSKIISIPKLKTHVSATMTCSLKNLIGLLPDSEKRNVHIWGVHKAIPDIYKVLRPALTVVDAVTCLQGDGPTYGDKIDLGIVVASRDALSTDRVCSQIIGLPWEDISYLKFGGDGDCGHIEVVGERLSEVQIHFKIPKKHPVFHSIFRLIYVFDIPFAYLFGRHLNEYLYSTGYVGTNPKIIKKKCNRCGDCLEACPEPEALEIQHYRVDHKKCIRCLNCFYACKSQAINVKGLSRPAE